MNQVGDEKSVFVLVGPKGAGKSHLGSRLENELGVPFLRVEPIWLELMRETSSRDAEFDREGQRRILEQVSRLLAASKSVVLESTGAAPWFGAFISDLEKLGRVVLIRVTAPLPQCLDRIKRRDATSHIPVSDDRINEINAVASSLVLHWTYEFENCGHDGPDRFLIEFKKRFLDR